MSLSDVFDKVREDNHAAFIGYYPAGFPTTNKSIENIKAIVDAGADITEVGLPSSNPMMDGPTIRDAANVALDASFRIREIMRIVREVTEHGSTCVVMSYWNPTLQCGPERLAEDLAAAGGHGTIIPDLIPEEAGQWQRTAEANGLSNIMLVASSPTSKRLQLTAIAPTGFVYTTGHMGVTGVQISVDSTADKLVTHTYEVTDTPVCIGLGVSSGEQAAGTAEFADSVTVSSALIKAAMKGTDDLIMLARELAAGARGES